VPTIYARLTADPVRYPAADPETGWTLGGIYAILRNPKYTGYQVFGRRRNGRPVPPERWYWSKEATHPAIVDRHTWDAAQQAGAQHSSARDTSSRNPANWRTYPLRSRVRCKICKRRMCGITSLHPQNKTRTEYAYYMCQYNPANAGHVAAAPGHPRTVKAREDLLLGELRDGLSAYALAPGRAGRLAQLIPASTAAQQDQRDHQAAALRSRLKQIDTAADNLMTELDAAAHMPAKAAGAYRARIRQRFTDLHTERETIDQQLAALEADTTPASDPRLIDLLPEIAGNLADLPAEIQAELFAAFDIHILWNPPMRQATFNATITDTTPGIITALLTRADQDGPAATAAHPGSSTPAGITPATSGNPAPHDSSEKLSGSLRLPICGKPDPNSRSGRRRRDQPVFWRPAATPFTVSRRSRSSRSRSAGSSAPGPRSAARARNCRCDSAST
jgi:hypothetical protein